MESKCWKILYNTSIFWTKNAQKVTVKLYIYIHRMLHTYPKDV